MDKVVKPKTARGKRVLIKKEPQVHEGPKNCMFIKGSTANLTTTTFQKDICVFKKPNAVFLSKKEKNLIQPFENATPIEFMAKKNDCALFMLSSHSKKRPNNIVMGRTFDNNIMEMFEFGIDSFKSMSQFKNSKIALESKPLLIFGGQQFEEENEYKRLKNFLIDFFSGPPLEGLRLSGVEHLIQIVAHESKIYLRSYKINLKSTGTKYGKLELEEMGPRVDLSLRRSKLASDDLLKKAMKKPQEVKIKKIKNVARSKLGTTFGRIHMTRQDYAQLQTRKMKGLKKNAVSDNTTSVVSKMDTSDATQRKGNKRPADTPSKVKTSKKVRFVDS